MATAIHHQCIERAAARTRRQPSRWRSNSAPVRIELLELGPIEVLYDQHADPAFHALTEKAPAQVVTHGPRPLTAAAPKPHPRRRARAPLNLEPDKAAKFLASRPRAHATATCHLLINQIHGTVKAAQNGLSGAGLVGSRRKERAGCRPRSTRNRAPPARPTAPPLTLAASTKRRDGAGAGGGSG